MAPSRTIQRKIRKFGIFRFSKATGTHDAAIAKRMGEMLDELVEGDEFGIVWELHRGRMSLAEAFAGWQRKGVRGIRELFRNTSLELEAFERYAAAQDWSDRTRADHLYNFGTLMRYARSNDRLADLPDVLRRFREEVLRKAQDTTRKRRAGRRVFNYARRTALQWIGFTQGKASETYLEAREVAELKAEQKKRRLYLSPRDIQAIIDRMPTNVGAMFWTLATTGAGPKEYLHDGMTVEHGGILINGQKTPHRVRVVPLAYPPARPCLRYSGLRSSLRKATEGTPYEGKVNIYDCRRSYFRWLLQAGVDYSRVQQYAGHREQTMTDRYLFADVHSFLEADAKLLRGFIEKDILKVLTGADEAEGPKEHTRQTSDE